MSFKTSKLAEHAFPGNLTDMTSQDDQNAWSTQYISNWMGNEIAGNEQGVRIPHSNRKASDVTLIVTAGWDSKDSSQPIL